MSRLNVRIRRTLIPCLGTIVLLTSGVVGPDAGRAESPQPASTNELVLEWMQGDYATPLLCTIDGQPVRGLRTIALGPADFRKQPAEASIHFVDLEADEASRCFTEFKGPSPNITGTLVVRHPATKARDTARRDFEQELRRNRGFELKIVSGALAANEVGSSLAPGRLIDFRGGTFRIRILRPGSDGLRLLQDLPSPRKVQLEFKSRDGSVFSFPASLLKPEAESGSRPQSMRKNSPKGS